MKNNLIQLIIAAVLTIAGIGLLYLGALIDPQEQIHENPNCTRLYAREAETYHHNTPANRLTAKRRNGTSIMVPFFLCPAEFCLMAGIFIGAVWANMNP